MTPQNIFTPKPLLTQTLAVTTSAASLTFNGGFETIRCYNGGSAVCFIEFGGGTATATNSMPLAPGAIETFAVPAMGQPLVVSAIGASATTLYVTPGFGA